MIVFNNIDKVIDSFVNGDYFIIFLVLTLIILIILVLALIKSREDYNELLLRGETKKKNNAAQGISSSDEEDFMGDLRSLMASSKEDMIDADKPLIKQVDIKGIKTYDDEIDEYELSEEDNAVISAEELEQKAKERKEILGLSENQEVIAKYEEEQEKKAIISYEQLLKNASNITLSYKEEEQKTKGAPRINKIELEQKEVTPSENYLKEEEFLKILKEFRISIQ